MAEAICRFLRDGSLEGEHSSALAIKDCLQSHAGAYAFNYFLCSLAADVGAGKSQARGLVLVAFCRHPSFYSSLLKRKGLDASLSVNKCDIFILQILDCYSDPLGWKEKIIQSSGPNKPTAKEWGNVCREVKDINRLLSSILELGKGFAEGRPFFSVAIDSVSEMLRHASLQSVANFISNLRSHGQVSSMLWLMHSDLQESRSNAVFDYMSSAVASLEPIGQMTYGHKGLENLFSLGLQSHQGRFHVRIKRRNGRVKLFSEEFHLKQAGITFVTPSSENISGGQTLLPKLQFNLRLSEKERHDRERVLLPFEHQGNGEPIQIYDGRQSLAETNKDLKAIQQTKGEIHYLRDSDDERPDSDEDPDDDLDI